MPGSIEISHRKNINNSRPSLLLAQSINLIVSEFLERTHKKLASVEIDGALPRNMYNNDAMPHQLRGIIAFLPSNVILRPFS